MEWISVEDRLPEVGSAVIAAVPVEEERDRFEQWWFGCCIYREYGFPWVKFDNPNPITHWMPLPEPPKAD